MSQTKAQLINAVDGSIVTADLADDAVTAAKLAHTSVTAGSYTTADITVDAQGRITAAASGTISNAEIADGAITNAKVNASAAIAGSKISPSFTANTTITAASPVLRLADSTDPQGTDGIIGKLEFFGNDGSSGGADVRSFIQTISTNSVGNSHALTIGLGESNNAPTEKVRILGDGKIGIGTTSPAEELVVRADAPSIQLESSNASGRNYGLQANNDGKFHAYDGTAGANRVTLDSSGNVGIGTTSPQEELHISADTPVIRLTDSSTDRDAQFVCIDGSLRIDADNSNAQSSTNIAFRTDGSERMRIDSAGNVGIGTTSPVRQLDINNSSHATLGLTSSTQSSIFFADSDTNVGQISYNHASNYLYFRVNDAERVRIDSSGNVGIGTTSPGSIFHVQPLDETNFLVRNEGSTLVLASETNSGRDSNRGMALEATTFEFIEGGSEKMRIDSSGRLMIGTSVEGNESADDLTVHGSTNTGITVRSGTSNNGSIFFSDATSGTAEYAGFVQYAHADNALNLGTASTTRMKIDSAGRVGVGCTPTAQFNHSILQIGNQATLGANGALSTTGQTYLTHNLYFDPSGNYQVFNTSNANEGTIFRMFDGNFQFSNSAQTTGTPTVTERMRIDSSGKVGIGTTSPSSRLSVVEAASATALHVKMGTNTNQNTHLELENDGSADIRFGCFGSSANTFGNITANNGFIHTTNDLSINAASSTGNVKIGTGATPSTKLFVKNDGLVGIGTTSPETLLHAKVNTFSDDINKVALTLSNNQSSGVHQYFQNASTGTGVSNGARIGLGNTDNFLIQQFEAKDIQISTNGTERMRIKSDGKVGIGTTSPGALLHVDSDSATAGIRVSGDGNSFLELDADSSIAGTQISFIDFKLAGTVEANIAVNESVSGNPLELNSATDHDISMVTGGGKVGIGTSNPGALKLHLYDATDTSSSREQFRISGGDRTADSFETGFRFFTVSPSANGNRHYRLTANGNIGLTIQGHETSTGNAASDRAILLNPSGGAARFGTSSNISGENFTFFRQESDGAILAAFHQAASADVNGIYMRHGRGLSGFSGKMISFRRNDGTEVGSVAIGASSTAFNTSSDYRLKENVTPISDGITRLKTLKPYRFNFKDDTTKPVVDGFFAHEVTAVPEAITGTKDEVDSDNNPVYQSIDQSKLVPLLVAAVQELIGRVEILEAA